MSKYGANRVSKESSIRLAMPEKMPAGQTGATLFRGLCQILGGDVLLELTCPNRRLTVIAPQG